MREVHEMRCIEQREIGALLNAAVKSKMKKQKFLAGVPSREFQEEIFTLTSMSELRRKDTDSWTEKASRNQRDI